MVTELKLILDLFDSGVGAVKLVTNVGLIADYRHGQRLALPPISRLLPR